ncbi:MAG: diguanylate cyclase, partial [Campylobacterota bacterium]|nr:diguanylate cyclase [Campylobacterota bacterium]
MGRVHSSIYLLILFLSLVSGGLFYYIDMSKSEQQYIHTQSKLMNLKFLDRDFDNFFYQYAFFTNFDHINRDIKRFEVLLFDLKEDIVQLSGDKEGLSVMLQNIDKSFDERKQAVEYFKSQKATLLNAIHFLHDLQATIQEDSTLLLVQDHIQESLFASMQYLIAEYIDTELIKNNLETIKEYAKKKAHKRLLTYVHHNSLLLQNIIELKKLTQKAKSHKIEPTLEALGFELDILYQESVKIQKAIALLLFVFSIVVLLILIILQIKFLRSKRELQAYKYAVEHSDNTIVLTDIHKNITYVNDLFETNTGYTKDEVLGKNPRIFSSGEQDDTYYKNMHEQLSKGESWQGEFINRRKDGSLYYERASIVPIFLDNELINYLAIKLDITEYIEQNLELQQAASLFENTEEAILITDIQNRITRVNNAFCTMYGYKEDEVIGKNPNIIRSNSHDLQYFAQMWSQINTTGSWRGKIYNRTKSGEVTPIWMTVKVIYDRDGNISSYTAIQTDLREIEASQARAKYLAYNDPLCDLPNRISFEQHLKGHISKAKVTQKHFALLFIDLDRLKVINDTLGHIMGDELLKSIAKRLLSMVGKNDYLARWGGDEFVYLLTDLSSQEEVIFKTTILLDAIKESVVINESRLTTTASIGIACYPKDAQESDRLIKYADSAMYHAKEQGKNTYHFYTKTLSKEIQRKLDIELALRKA